MAPEIVRRLEYEGKPVDIWSMGILLYALLCGCFPFRAKSYPDLYRRIARGTFAIPEEFSPAVKDLLRQLLAVDVTQRINAQALLRHPWLASQLATAPDIAKLRKETPILISDKADDDLDDATLDEIAKFGIGRDEMTRQVLTKTHSALSTLYYLLLDHLLEVRRQYRKGAAAQTKQRGGLSAGITGHGAVNQFNTVNVVIPSSSSSGGAVRPSSAGEIPPYMQSTQSKHIRDTIVVGSNPQQGADGYARPRSASAGRPSAQSNRPSSAHAGRTRINIV
jgi:serine/threonine protein kinase